MQALLDVARVVTVVFALTWIFLLVFAAMSSITRYQRGRMIATALLLSTAIGSQVERLGEPFTWLTLRLPVFFLACVYGGWCTWMFVFRDDGNGRRHRPFRRNGAA